jgi:sugar/nucleoside kinase (ribokinase family)
MNAVPLPRILPRADRPFDVAGLGQNSLDIVVRLDDFPAPDSRAEIRELARLTGGEIATALVACARLGCRTTYVGTVGRPPEGSEVEASLARAGVDLSHLRRVDADNRLAVILVDADGGRTVLWRRSAALTMSKADVDPAAVTNARVLLVDAIDAAASAQAAEYARASGAATVIDVDSVQPDMHELLRRIDVIIASGEFVHRYTGATAIGSGLRRLAADTRAALVVATLGSEGSLALLGTEEIQTPAFRVPVVDTTGAGDAFRGGFIAAWLRGGGERSVAELLETASAVAALNCGAVGAQAGLPDWDTVDVLVTRTDRDRSK